MPQSLSGSATVKTAFLALLAHELRNPLAPIRNALHVLERVGSPDETAERMRAMIGRQLQQLTRLVDDLLDVARISRGPIDVRKERIELGALVDGAAEAARPGFEAGGIELTATRPAEALALDADPVRLAQAIGNLLNNAGKFTDVGGRIWLSLERDGAEAVIRVRDSGIGMAADQLSRIFEMFVQIDASIGRSRGGLGLGLSVVRQLVDAHGGSVVASSDGIGRGSAFELRLPLADGSPRPAAPAAKAKPAAAHATPAASPRRRVLLVDDNVDVAEPLAAILAAAGPGGSNRARRRGRAGAGSSVAAGCGAA